MKDQQYFTSFDVWEYITLISKKESVSRMEVRYIDLREYSEKFSGYMISPIVSHEGKLYTAKTARFFDEDCLYAFLKSMSDASIVLHSVESVYEFVTTLSDSTFDIPAPIDPYIEHYVIFRYAESL